MVRRGKEQKKAFQSSIVIRYITAIYLTDVCSGLHGTFMVKAFNDTDHIRFRYFAVLHE